MMLAIETVYNSDGNGAVSITHTEAPTNSISLLDVDQEPTGITYIPEAGWFAIELEIDGIKTHVFDEEEFDLLNDYVLNNPGQYAIVINIYDYNPLMEGYDDDMDPIIEGYSLAFRQIDN